MFGPDQLGVASVFLMTAEGVATTSEDTSPGVATSERVAVRSFGLAAVAGLLSDADTHATMGAAGRRHVEEAWTWDVMGARLTEILS